MLKDSEISTPPRVPMQTPMTAAVADRQPPVRVYFINRYFYPDESATAQLLADLAFGLAMRDFEVHIVCSRQIYGAPETRLPPREIVRGVAVHRLWTTRFGRERLAGRAIDYLTFYLTCALTLARDLRKWDIVVAKTDPPLISIVAAAVTGLKGAVLVNWLQDVFPEVATKLGSNPLPAGLGRLLLRLRDWSLRAAAVNVALGGRMREYLQTRGIPADKIQVIENWADTGTVRPKRVMDSKLRIRAGLADKFVVGYSGNLGRAHEFLTLLGAAKMLRDERQIVFLMIGGGINMKAFEAEAAQQQLTNVHFLPYQTRETLEDSLAAADVHLASLIPALEGLVVPSKFYGILAAGRPVVFIGDVDGELARIIRANRCGMVVASGQSGELVDAIRYLHEHGRERAAMGLSARELCCNSYSSSGTERQWVALLEHVQVPIAI